MAKANSLEENFKELDNIIKKLENNELELDDAFAQYELGVKLVAECNKQIDKVEKKIIVLKEKTDEQ